MTANTQLEIVEAHAHHSSLDPQVYDDNEGSLQLCARILRLC